MTKYPEGGGGPGWPGSLARRGQWEAVAGGKVASEFWGRLAQPFQVSQTGSVRLGLAICSR